jgi:hypothetical protein
LRTATPIRLVTACVMVFAFALLPVPPTSAAKVAVVGV